MNATSTTIPLPDPASPSETPTTAASNVNHLSCSRSTPARAAEAHDQRGGRGQQQRQREQVGDVDQPAHEVRPLAGRRERVRQLGLAQRLRVERRRRAPPAPRWRRRSRRPAASGATPVGRPGTAAAARRSRRRARRAGASCRATPSIRRRGAGPPPRSLRVGAGSSPTASPRPSASNVQPIALLGTREETTAPVVAAPRMSSVKPALASRSSESPRSSTPLITAAGTAAAIATTHRIHGRRAVTAPPRARRRGPAPACP